MRDKNPKTTGTKNRSPLVWALSLALVVVLVDSLMTTAVAIADRSPLPMGLGITLGSATGSLLFAFGLGPRCLIRAITAPKAGLGRMINGHLGLMTLSRLDWPLFALAASWIGVTATAVIWSLQPIVFLVCLRWLVYDSDGQKRYRALSRKSWVWLLVALAGLILVILGRPAETATGSGWLVTGLGVATALAGLTCSGLSATRFEWGLRLKDRLGAGEAKPTAFQLITLGMGLVLAFLGLVGGLIILASGNWPDWSDLWPGFLMGATLAAAGLLLTTELWLKHRRLELGGIFYLIPVSSVGLLWLVGRLGPIKPGFIAAGGFLILIANLALGRRSGQSAG